MDRVAGIDQPQEPPVGIAEIGHGVERDIGDRLAEDEMKGQQVLDRCRPEPVGAREWIRAVLQKARAGQGEVERGITGADGARRGVADLLTDVEILEEVAGGGLAHLAPSGADAASRQR